MSNFKDYFAEIYNKIHFVYQGLVPLDIHKALEISYDAAWNEQQKTIDNLIAALRLAETQIDCYCQVGYLCSGCCYLNSKERKLVEPLLKEKRMVSDGQIIFKR